MLLLVACGPREAPVIPGAMIDPGDRTRSGICARWKAGHVITTPQAFMPGGGSCAPGALKPGAIEDTLTRIDMFRWLAGLDPVENDPTFDVDAQACSTIAAFWDFMRPANPHMPPEDSTCWSAQGQRGAGSSNISWGVRHPANSIDSFIEDAGANNVDALGHRRWILNPPLGPVGVGYYEGGSNFGSASCLRVFGMTPGQASPAWNAVPPPGFAPIEMARWTWSFQGSVAGISAARVTMEKSDGTPLMIEVHRLQAGSGQPAVAWVPVGWTVEAGETYTVTVGNVSYDVTPVDCTKL